MDIDNLHKDWVALAENYFDDFVSIQSSWKKIQKNYTSKNRYYHNLMHINSMLEKALENRDQITKYDEFLFAIWFHDIIYKSTSKRNEEKSADFAVAVLQKITKGKLNLNMIHQLIISTKSHQIISKENEDNAFLLDFDLAILGSNWNIYKNYIQNIRKEYKMYPDFLYNPARKKVLFSFLNREELYFTVKYKELFEENARENLTREIDILS